MRFWFRAALGLAVGVLGLVLVEAAVAAPIQIGSIDADYGVTTANTTTFHITNTSSAPISKLLFSGAGYGGTLDQVTGQLAPDDPLFAVAPGDTYTVSFAGSGVFGSDLAAGTTGNVAYTFTGLWNDQSLFAFFSPDLNNTGDFVGFLGHDANGSPGGAPVGRTTLALLKAEDTGNNGGNGGGGDPEPPVDTPPPTGGTPEPPVDTPPPTTGGNNGGSNGPGGVAAAPEPSTLFLAGVGAVGGFLAWRRKRRQAGE